MMRQFKRWLAAGLVLVSLPGLAWAKRAEAVGGLYIVVLEEPSLAEKVVEWTPGMSWRERREVLGGERALEYRRGLQLHQERFVGLAAARIGETAGPVGGGLTVTDRKTLLLNALFVKCDEDAARRIAGMSGVWGVFPNRRMEPLMDAVPAFVGATQVWDLLGGLDEAGAGMRIAVIDSGIDVSHPMFQDSGLTAPVGFPLPSDQSEHTNSKVIVARNYVSEQYGLKNEPEPVDERGHGSIVAGIAAGAPAEAPLGTVRGVAPRAYLGNYRVFGSPAKNPFATDSSVIAAIEGAVADGMDVINLSLGGDPREPARDPEQIAIANATRLGVVVVVAAGNLGGNGAGTVTSPGTSPEAITVGSTSHPRLFGNPIRITSAQSEVPEPLRDFVQVPGSGAPILAGFGPLPLTSIRSLDSSELACDALPAGSLRGMVALVRRGNCFFSVKAANVLDTADAAAMVVYNNVEGTPFRMDFGERPPQRPAVMIDMTRGLTLSDLLAAGEVLEVTLGARNEVTSTIFEGPLQLSDFSGRGPAIDLGVKPDLSAPGESLYSAAVNPDGEATLFTNPTATRGTSFSTPIVAGGAALLRQLHPDWSVAQIKSALVNRSDSGVTVSGRAPRATEAGAGRLDLARAASAQLFAEPVSLGFGIFGDEGGSMTLTLTNSGPAVAELRLGVEAPSPVARLEWGPDQISLQPGESRPIAVALRPGGLSGSLDGFFEVRDAAGAVVLRIPYFGVAVVRETGRTLLVSQAGGGQFSSLPAALGEALPGDVIEIGDDASYPGPLAVGRNAGGIPLDGLTIRAGAGRRPVIDYSNVGSQGQSAISVEGLNRVTIQGLTIRSAGTGVEFVDSTGTLKDNIILLQASETPQDGIRALDSRVHLTGNLVTDAGRNGVSLVNSAALVQNNRVLSSSEDGLAAMSGGPTALFGNRFEGTVGVGIRSFDTDLLAKSNQVLGGARSRADGVLTQGAESTLAMIDNLVAGSGGSGVAVEDGASARLLGDAIEGSLGPGITLEGAAAEGEAVRLLGNGLGVRLSDGDLRISNSLVAQSLTGPGLDLTQGLLTVESCTVADNAGFGIHRGDGSLSVSNSVLFGNREGDFSGGGEFRYSLFEANPPSGPGNAAGDPDFVDALAGEYAPQGSAAVDVGDPEAGGETDLNFHRRISDGDGDGQSRIDIGAVESGSHFGPSILLPILSTSPDDFVGLALVNAYQPAQQAAASAVAGVSRVVLNAYADDGVPFGGTYWIDIPSGGQTALLLHEAVGPLREGWVEIQPGRRDLMAFSLVGSGFPEGDPGQGLRSLDGSRLNSRLARRLLFVQGPAAGEEGRIHLVNPHPEAVTADVAWMRDDSTAEARLQLAAGGSFSAAVRDLLGPGEGGYLTVEAGSPLQGIQLFGNQERRAGLPALDLDEASQDLYAAQLASTPAVETLVNVVNLGPAGLIRFTARDENGAEISTVSRALPEGGQLRETARTLFGFAQEEVVGWLEIHSDSPMAGSVVFGDPAGRFLAALPLQSAGAREFYLSHVAETEELFTGLTILNAESRSALVSVEVFTAEGAPAGGAFLELAGGQKVARLLSEILGNGFRQAGGFLRVRSNLPVMGFELFGGYSLEYLSAVPAQVAVP